MTDSTDCKNLKRGHYKTGECRKEKLVLSRSWAASLCGNVKILEPMYFRKKCDDVKRRHVELCVSGDNLQKGNYLIFSYLVLRLIQYK